MTPTGRSPGPPTGQQRDPGCPAGRRAGHGIVTLAPMPTPTIPTASVVLGAAVRQVAAHRRQPHQPWAADPALAGHTVADIVAAVGAGDDPTIAALIDRTHAHDPFAPVVLLAGMHDHLFRRAYLNVHGYPDPDVVDEHATLAYLVIVDADPTQTRLLARLLGRVTSRYRKRVAADTATSTRQLTSIPDHDGHPVAIVDLLPDNHASVETVVEARLELHAVIGLVHDAIADHHLPADAWQSFLARRVDGRTPQTIAGAGMNPSTIRSQIHRTARWLADHDDRAA